MRLYYLSVLQDTDAAARDGRQAAADAAEVFRSAGKKHAAESATELLPRFDDLIAKLPP